MEQMKNRKEHEETEKFANGLADEFRGLLGRRGWSRCDRGGPDPGCAHWSCDYFQDPDPEIAGDHFQTD
ncbi:MAG: hypothetical protein ACLUD2_01390 [Clostridium sp.]